MPLGFGCCFCITRAACRRNELGRGHNGLMSPGVPRFLLALIGKASYGAPDAAVDGFQNEDARLAVRRLNCHGGQSDGRASTRLTAEADRLRLEARSPCVGVG